MLSSAPVAFFGETPNESLFLNNAAWVLRRSPLFLVPGDAQSIFQPIHVRDMAQMQVDVGDADGDVLIDAVGPEALNIEELCRAIGDAVGSKSLLVKHIPPALVWALPQPVHLSTGETILDQEELALIVDGLSHAVDSSNPTGQRKLTDWLDEVGPLLGREHISVATLLENDSTEIFGRSARQWNSYSESSEKPNDAAKVSRQSLEEQAQNTNHTDLSKPADAEDNSADNSGAQQSGTLSVISEESAAEGMESPVRGSIHNELKLVLQQADDEEHLQAWEALETWQLRAQRVLGSHAVADLLRPHGKLLERLRWKHSRLLQIKKYQAETNAVAHGGGGDWHYQKAGGRRLWYRIEPDGAVTCQVLGTIGEPLFRICSLAYEVDLHTNWIPFLTKARQLHDVRGSCGTKASSVFLAGVSLTSSIKQARCCLLCLR